MQEKQLINKLKELQQIKPRKDWVLLVKNQILADEKPAFTKGFSEAKQAFNILSFLPALIYQRKLAYAFATFLFMMVGMFGFAQYTVPGDALFSVKKFTEQSQTALFPGADQLKNSFEVANRRLSDLTQVVENKRTQNIAPSIKEFQASVFEVADKLSVSNLKAVSNPEAVKKVVNKLGITSYGFDIDLLYLMKRNGFKVIEIATEWNEPGESHLNIKKTSYEMFLSVIRLRLIYSPFKIVVKIYDKVFGNG